MRETSEYWATVGAEVIKAHILMHHELLHIHPTSYKIREHDIDEFMEVADKYGLHWAED